jgi:hypothetical protein
MNSFAASRDQIIELAAYREESLERINAGLERGAELQKQVEAVIEGVDEK